MKYDFTTIMDRHGKDSIAVDDYQNMQGETPVPLQEGMDAIPMWVADMNFPTAPSIVRAMQKRLEHPAFGYFSPRDDYYTSIIRWQRERNGVTGLTKEAIGYENGVLGGVISAVQAFSAPGDPILLHSPTYVGFTKVLEENGRKIILSPLQKDADGVWRIDFEDMEEKLRTHHIHLAVFCSPHNPTGRVWERWEIERVLELYQKYDCVVLSDEIWSDLLLDGHTHIPTQSVSEDARHRVMAFYAPSKTFNLAGLVGSYHIVYDAYLRDRLLAQSRKSEYNSMNVLSMHALIGAYSPEGMEWVDELRQTLSANASYACSFISKELPGVSVAHPQGTYMLFLDCEEWCKTHHQTMDELIRAGWEVGVIWQDGRPFHGTYGIRMNLALPESRVKEAFDRLKRYVFVD